MSDHGFHSDHLRPKNYPMNPQALPMSTALTEFYAWPGIAFSRMKRIYGATLLDIAPTPVNFVWLANW